jgi:hypothetical protein
VAAAAAAAVAAVEIQLMVPLNQTGRPAGRLTGQTDRKWSATAYKESMITK